MGCNSEGGRSAADRKGVFRSDVFAEVALKLQLALALGKGLSRPKNVEHSCNLVISVRRHPRWIGHTESIRLATAGSIGVLDWRIGRH